MRRTSLVLENRALRAQLPAVVSGNTAGEPWPSRGRTRRCLAERARPTTVEAPQRVRVDDAAVRFSVTREAILADFEKHAVPFSVRIAAPSSRKSSRRRSTAFTSAWHGRLRLRSLSASPIDGKARLRRENLGKKVDKDANLCGEPPASGMDRADRERVPLVLPQDASHVTRRDLASE